MIYIDCRSGEVYFTALVNQIKWMCDAAAERINRENNVLDQVICMPQKSHLSEPQKDLN